MAKKPATTSAAEAFGKRLRELRLEGLFSQEALADASGLNRTEIGILERGEREPILSTILHLARALSVKPERLIQGIDPASARPRKSKPTSGRPIRPRSTDKPTTR